MLKKAIGALLCLVMLVSALQLAPPTQIDTVAYAATLDESNSKIDLTNWKIACSGSVATSSLPTATNLNNTIQPGFDTSGWLPASVPGSIEGALVDAGAYGANVGMKLDPDGKYDIYYDDNFAKVPIGDYANPWWYSNDFTLSTDQASSKVTLTFKGISYTGRVFVNGNEVTNKNISIRSDNELRNRSGTAPNWTYTDVTNTITANNSSVGGTGFGVNDFDNYKTLFKGAFRTYELDISEFIEAGSNNIKVLVTRPVYKSDSSDNATSGDFAPFWVDWHPTPADMNGGMLGRAFITMSADVRLSNPAAVAVVATDLSSADMKFYVDVNNLTGTAVEGVLKAVVYGPDGLLVANLPDTPVTVAANAYCQEVALATWTVEDPELWWPYLSGDQPLYNIQYSFVIGAQTEASDVFTHRFGIRQIVQRVTTSSVSSSSNQPQMQIYVNHQPIICKGGGYCPTDLLLRQSKFNDQACIDLVKSMGMNMIRDEGKFFSENLLSLMDENGILYMTGWCCCDRHQNPNSFTKAERFVTFESLYSQLRTIRAHACAAVWLNGSDSPPDSGSNANGQNIARKYLEIEGRLRFYDLGIVSCSAEATASNLSGGRSGLHMDSSYDAQSASLAYTSNSQGSFGFISEGHGGPGVPYVESLRRFIPETNLWPYNSGANYNVWNYHSARASFANIDQQQVFVDGVYGASDTIDVANARAQLFQYEIQRASYEALNFYRFNQSTGLINWMLNDARPGIMWNQFDYYMNPFGSTFGAGKANEPLHIMYNPAMIAAYNPAGQTVAPTAHSISVVNSTREAYNGMIATATIYDINGNIINTPLVKTVDIRPDGIVALTGNATNRTTGYIPNGEWITGGFSNFTVAYAQTATGSTGLTVLWTNSDIIGSLIKPTSDVYFLRLELADSDGKVVSYNNYAVPRRESVNGTSSSWARGSEAQTQDLTMLNSLPAIDMQSGLVLAQTGSVKVGDRITQTFTVTNNTGVIAYGVDLKAYMDSTLKTLVAPSIYSDNLMIVFPGQTRVVTITHYASVLDKDSVVTINCYNNVIKNKPARVGNVYDTVYNRNTATPTTTSATTNLAKGITASGLTNGANATAIASVALSNAASTVIDSNMATVATLATSSTTGFTLDLGSAPVKYDKVMIRWNANTSTGGNPNMLAGVPTTIRVDTSANNSTWNTNVLTFDNTDSRSAMTEIIFPVTQTARYIRFVPNGTVGNAAAYGAVSGAPGGGFRHSVSARNAASNWNISGIEVYGFKSSAFIDALSGGKITVASRDYTMANNALERQIQSSANGEINFTFTPDGTGSFKVTFDSAYPKFPIAVFRDGVDISDSLSADNELSLSGITAATSIRAVFDGSEMLILEADMDKLIPGDVVNIAAQVPASYPSAGVVYFASYAGGRMIAVQSFSATQGVLLEAQATVPAGATEVKLFLWDANTFIPLCKDVSIK
ncbi:MAG: hypothetical protein FWH57_02820 [Oscillospiraceae bacterium]|nr:hypothetical protein [Oscillospiraceae bacterium]